jgi:Na+-driven multidrug efflux pump
MPLTVESLLMQGGMLLIQIYLARLTTTDLAAHAVANSIFNLYSTTSGALNTMASTICGQCFGAGRRDLVRQYCRNLIRVGRWILLATSLILYPMTPLLLRLYHPTPEGARLVMQALAVAAAAFPVFWCDAYLPAMTMRVAGDSAVMGIISVVSLALCRCALGYFLTIPMGLGLMGAWLGTVTEWVLRAVLLHLRFRGDRWLPSPSGS